MPTAAPDRGAKAWTWARIARWLPSVPLLITEVAVARFSEVTLKLPLMAVESAVAVATVGVVLAEVLALIAVDSSRFCTLPWNVISWLEMALVGRVARLDRRLLRRELIERRLAELHQLGDDGRRVQPRDHAVDVKGRACACSGCGRCGTDGHALGGSYLNDRQTRALTRGPAGSMQVVAAANPGERTTWSGQRSTKPSEGGTRATRRAMPCGG